MKLGSSKPWPEVLESITGSKEMSAEPLIEYFRPLGDWLRNQNSGHPVGWQDACPPGSFTTEE